VRSTCSAGDALDPKFRWVAAAVVVALGLVTTACGGNRGSAYGEADAVTEPGLTVVVQLKNLQFSPKAIRVHTGTTVTWVNDDPVLHNVASVDSVFLSPDPLPSGDRFSFTFTQPGTYRYQCIYHHPTMLGVVLVAGP
jgi:plastocyanin